jgi:hypothetical protein
MYKNIIKQIVNSIKYTCVIFATWCGWLSFIDQNIINRYLSEAVEKNPLLLLSRIFCFFKKEKYHDYSKLVLQEAQQFEKMNINIHDYNILLLEKREEQWNIRLQIMLKYFMIEVIQISLWCIIGVIMLFTTYRVTGDRNFLIVVLIGISFILKKFSKDTGGFSLFSIDSLSWLKNIFCSEKIHQKRK